MTWGNFGLACFTLTVHLGAMRAQTARPAPRLNLMVYRHMLTVLYIRLAIGFGEVAQDISRVRPVQLK